MKISNIFKHIKLVTKHKWVVFKLCCKVGIPWRGFMHDWSKFSFDEFWESVKYYDGKISPITRCKQKNGYSIAWLHHKGRNKHHPAYWIDEFAPEPTPVIPYKYAVEMLCDKMSAAMTYKKDKFTTQYVLDYWNRELPYENINPKTKQFITAVLEQCVKNGIDKTFTKKNFKELYKKYCE